LLNGKYLPKIGRTIIEFCDYYVEDISVAEQRVLRNRT